MNYQEALDFLKEAQVLGSKLGLERLEKLLNLLGNPEKQLKYVHLAGTNGKGSTAAMIASVLSCAGYRTGLFTSPYLENVNEQIRLNGQIISNEAFAHTVKKVKAAVEQLSIEERPTEFEIITAVAFLYFYEEKSDIVVLETGMGGKTDATNVIPTPQVTVFTNIGMDHMTYLGDSLDKIADCKAGIIKENSHVVSYEQSKEVQEVLKKHCEKQHATLTFANFSDIMVHEEHLSMQKFSYQEYKEISLPLIGEHQRNNTAVALETIRELIHLGYNIPMEMIKRGLFQVNWPARFEILAKRPLVILDGAHNIQCIKEIKKVLGKYVPDRKIIFVMGVMADKDYKPMIGELLPIAKEFITVTPNNKRALSAINLAMAIHDMNGYATAEESVADGIMTALEEATPSDVICILGSLYMAAEVRDCFMS